jgi:hypothetical protein
VLAGFLGDNMAAPVITSQPSSTIPTRGSSFTLSVTATGATLTYQWYKNDYAITGATSESYSKTYANSADNGIYHVVVTSAGIDTTQSNYISVAETRIDQIALEIWRRLKSITTANGYAYNFGTINNWKYGNPSYPMADITFESENMIDADLSHFGFAECEFKIKIKAAITSTQDIPTHAIDAEANKVLSDIKNEFREKLGRLQLIDESATIRYDRSLREISPAGGAYIPGVLNTFWKVQYQN